MQVVFIVKQGEAKPTEARLAFVTGEAGIIAVDSDGDVGVHNGQRGYTFTNGGLPFSVASRVQAAIETKINDACNAWADAGKYQDPVIVRLDMPSIIAYARG